MLLNKYEYKIIYKHLLQCRMYISWDCAPTYPPKQNFFFYSAQHQSASEAKSEELVLTQGEMAGAVGHLRFSCVKNITLNKQRKIVHSGQLFSKVIQNKIEDWLDWTGQDNTFLWDDRFFALYLSSLQKFHVEVVRLASLEAEI